MPYRDDQAALESLRDELRRDLAEATRKAEALAGAARAKDDLTRELASVEARLARLRSRRLPLLETVKIASPCTASWDDMAGDERVRFCGSCQKNVYNLSAMASDEAERLLAEREGSMCVRLYQRTDGTVLTADCPVGVRRKRVRRTLVAAGSAGVLAAMAFGGARTRMGAPVPGGEVTTGVVAMGGLPIPPPMETVEPASTGSVAAPRSPVMPRPAVMGGRAAPVAPASPRPATNLTR